MNNNINNEITEYQKLFDGSSAEQYVISRGISKETYKQFQLGYKKGVFSSKGDCLIVPLYDSIYIEKMIVPHPSIPRYIPFSETERYFRTPLIEKDGPMGIRAVIKQMYGSESVFSKELGLSKHMLSTRLNFETDFRYSELRKMAELLEMSIADIDTLIQIERRILNEQKSQGC